MQSSTPPAPSASASGAAPWQQGGRAAPQAGIRPRNGRARQLLPHILVNTARELASGRKPSLEGPARAVQDEAVLPRAEDTQSLRPGCWWGWGCCCCCSKRKAEPSNMTDSTKRVFRVVIVPPRPRLPGVLRSLPWQGPSLTGGNTRVGCGRISSKGVPVWGDDLPKHTVWHPLCHSNCAGLTPG